MKRILVIDIGGSKIKLLVTGQKQPIKIASGPNLTPQAMFAAIEGSIRQWHFDGVSIGYPGVVVDGIPQEDAPNLGRGWARFDFRRAFHRPVKIINDAAMQALGSYSGGRMLFLGLGTGLGSTLIIDGLVHPLELGDLTYRNNRPYFEYLGKAARRSMGRKRWVRHALAAVRGLKAALQVDYVVLGGGGAHYVGKPPAGVVLGDNSKAFVGGFRLWQREYAKCVVRRQWQPKKN